MYIDLRGESDDGSSMASLVRAPLTRAKGSFVGEVRVQVRLINAADRVLVRRGQLAPDRIRRYEANGLVDTGAVRTVVPAQVAEALDLGIEGRTVVEYADGRQDVVGVTEPVIVEVMGRETAEDALVLGDEVLVGQTVLEKLDLFIDPVNRRVVPNPDHPDQPVTKVK